MKQFSLAVIIYMTLGICWWGVLLYSKNQVYYDLQLNQLPVDSDEYHHLKKEKYRQSIMVISEGIVLGISLLAGIWIIYRSGLKQIEAANSQNNFLLSVSHELKSPIASIKLALQTLQKRKLDDADRNKLTVKAVADADRLESLVQNILMSAGMDQGKIELFLENIDFNELILRILSKYQDNGYHVHLDPNLRNSENTLIYADRLSLELAVANVVDNAIKYSKPGGNVSIVSNTDSKYVTLSVEDAGIGIPPGLINMVFNRFWRSSQPEVRRRKGTGLGLYISQTIVEAHKGKIYVDHADTGTGARFTFKLPIATHG